MLVCAAVKRSTVTGQFRPEPDRVKFWRKVKKTRSCWFWTGSVDKDGYGWFFGLGQKKAHRASFVLHCRPIPDHKWILHSCDNPGCVRPDHLYVGTPKQNAIDRRDRNPGSYASGDRNGMRTHPGQVRGAKNPMAKLDEAAVKRIRRLRVRGLTQEAIACKFDVSRKTISSILSGKSWRHV